MRTILSIFGTRPEAIKMAPVIKALEQGPDHFRSIVCVTGQHRQMLDQALDIFAIKPDYDLGLMQQGQDLFDITANVLRTLKTVIEQVHPDLILVHGDTTTTLAASLAAYYCQIPVAHVEAGLRTGMKYAPFPEEVNRRIAGVVADLHFAPTEGARQNLLREGVSDKSIHVTGNTVIDALLITVAKIEEENLGNKIATDLITRFPSLARVLPASVAPSVPKSHLILVTGHRRENFGDGFDNICRALRKIATSRPEIDIIYPVHLNPNVQAPVRSMLDTVPNIHLIEPLDYLPFVYLMDRAALIITDSGGIQEEAPSLGKPVLVMREITERPEALAAGTVLLVGTDAARIVREAMRRLDNPADTTLLRTRNPYGDGHAAERIVKVLASFNCQELMRL